MKRTPLLFSSLSFAFHQLKQNICCVLDAWRRWKSFHMPRHCLIREEEEEEAGTMTCVDLLITRGRNECRGRRVNANSWLFLPDRPKEILFFFVFLLIFLFSLSMKHQLVTREQKECQMKSFLTEQKCSSASSSTSLEQWSRREDRMDDHPSLLLLVHWCLISHLWSSHWLCTWRSIGMSSLGLTPVVQHGATSAFDHGKFRVRCHCHHHLHLIHSLVSLLP